MTSAGDVPDMADFVLACRPVLTSDYRRRLVSLGLDPTAPELLPTAAPDSIVETCDECGAPVWVGPRQQALRAAHTCTPGILCLLCAWESAGAMAAGGFGAFFGSLGGE